LEDNFLYFSLSLPTDLKKNPLKTIIPARAEPTMFLSSVRCVNTIVCTNVIAAVTAAKGIQYLMAVEDLSFNSIYLSLSTNR
jgi:hypothetical protein